MATRSVTLSISEDDGSSVNKRIEGKRKRKKKVWRIGMNSS
jgi:hypothetical protein